MLTGQRRAEIGALRWSEIVGDKIVLPGSRTKNGRGHVIPLTAAVRTILEERPRTGEAVFGRSQGFRGWAWSKVALDQRIRDSGAVLAHWTHHDLRRSMATRMAESGTPPHVIEAILNHVGGTRPALPASTIAPAMKPQKRIALEKWAAHVEALASGKRAAKVVKLARIDLCGRPERLQRSEPA